MRIAIIGTGYVGLVVGTGLAENGHWVTCVDEDPSKIEKLREGKMPFYEPGLEELVMHNIEEERLCLATDIAEGVADKLLIFLCVGTPSGPDGAADMTQLDNAVDAVGRALSGYAIIVVKSTVPIGTTERVRERVAELTSHPFDVVANPEFLKEGAAVDDFLRPDRVIVGCEDIRVLEIMRELYAPFLRTGKPFIAMNIRSAELAKYAANAMLAARISLMNELANIADAYGVDITRVREALMADSRLGSTYLFPGLAFGGSCLPKDVIAASRMAKDKALSTPVLDGVSATNKAQLQRFNDRLLRHYGPAISEKRIAIWGGSFKPRTDDIREAPALGVIDALLEAGGQVNIYDPVAGPNLKALYGDRITVAPKMYACLEETDGLVIATEWREFHRPDFDRMAGMMRETVIFDGRNLYNPKVIAEAGFRYFSIGRPDV